MRVLPQTRDLQHELTENTQRNENLKCLMLKARTKAQVISIVSIGAGDAFINRYFPGLRQSISNREVRLFVADQCTRDELLERRRAKPQNGKEISAANRRLIAAYEEFLHVERNSKGFLRYINSSDPSEKCWLDSIPADIIFALVPDSAHIRVMREWNKRATLVLVEKPYADDPAEAKNFHAELEELTRDIGPDAPTTIIVPFDHYLAKMRQYLRRRKQLVQSIGGFVTDIEFAILESKPVEEWRAGSLTRGMVYDLFSHVLATLSTELSLGWLDPNIVVRAARHKDSPTGETDTFADFKVTFKDHYQRTVPVHGAVGKGVGEKDEKFLKLKGKDGTLEFRFSDGKIYRTMKDAVWADEVATLGTGHGDLLESLLNGEYQKEPVGGLTAETALMILDRIGDIHRHMARQRPLPEYEVGDSLLTIRAKFPEI